MPAEQFIGLLDVCRRVRKLVKTVGKMKLKIFLVIFLMKLEILISVSSECQFLYCNDLKPNKLLCLNVVRFLYFEKLKELKVMF